MGEETSIKHFGQVVGKSCFSLLDPSRDLSRDLFTVRENRCFSGKGGFDFNSFYRASQNHGFSTLRRPRHGLTTSHMASVRGQARHSKQLAPHCAPRRCRCARFPGRSVHGRRDLRFRTAGHIGGGRRQVASPFFNFSVNEACTYLLKLIVEWIKHKFNCAMAPHRYPRDVSKHHLSAKLE